MPISWADLLGGRPPLAYRPVSMVQHPTSLAGGSCRKRLVLVEMGYLEEYPILRR